VGTALIHGNIDMMKRIGASRDCADAPKFNRPFLPDPSNE